MNLDWNKTEEGIYQAKLTTKLISVSDKVFKFDNEKQTEYRVCVIELENGKQASAVMYESNHSYGVNVGTSYASRAIYDPAKGKELFLTVSHLAAADRLTIEDLGFPIMDDVEAKAEETTTVL